MNTTAKILLIDDEPQIVKQFTRMLESEGFEVETASSGEEGWEKYQKQYYDVVLIDWKMGKMNGLEVMEKIDKMNPNAKTIMITAFGDEQTAIDAHNRHAFDYLKKPVEKNDLIDKVREALDRRDGILAALEDWVQTHPEEAQEPMKMVFSPEGEKKVWNAREILEEIRGNTEMGRKEYQNLVQLTIDLLTRGKIG
jgi:DNA-binding NtrC family response regulator